MSLGRKFYSLFLFLFLLVPLYSDNADNLYRTAVESVKDGFFLNAVNSLCEFIDYYPEDRRIESAYYLFAVSDYYLKNYRRALKTLSDLLANYPDTKYKNVINYWTGLSYYRLKDFRNAAGYFKIQTTKYSSNKDYYVKAQYYMASALAEISEFKGALSAYETVIKDGNKSTDSSIKAASVFGAGAIEFKQGDYSKSLRYFKQIIINYQDSPYTEDALFFSAECSFFLGMTASAEQRYRRFLNLYPKSRYRETAYYRLASLLTDLKKENESLKITALYEKSYPKGKYTVEIWKLKAKNLFDTGDFKNAEMFYKRIADRETKAEERQKSFYNIALCKINTGNNEEALKYLKLSSAGEDISLNEKALYREGQVLAKLGRNHDAVAVLSLFIQRYPDSIYKKEASVSLGFLYESLGSYKGAINVWGDLINGVESGREMDSLLYSRGSDYLKINNYTSALRDFSRIITGSHESPFFNRSCYQLGYIYSLKGEYKRALGYFLPLTGPDNTDGELKIKAEFAAGTAYFNMGEYKKSETHFKKIIGKSQSPGFNESELNGEAVLNMGRIKYKLQSYPEAEDYFLKAHSILKNSSEGIEALYWAGWAQFRAGNIKHAKGSFLEVATKYPENKYTASSYYRAGLCAYQLGFYRESIKYYNSALTADRGTGPGSVREAVLAGKGLSEFYSGLEKKALKTLKTLSIEFPQSRLAAEGYFKIGEYLFNKKQYEKAFENFSVVMKRFPHSSDSEAASFLAGKSLLMLKRYREAAESFFQYLRDYPDGSYDNEAGNLIRNSLAKLNNSEYADSLYIRVLNSKGMSEHSKSRLLFEYAVYKFPSDIEVAYKTLKLLRTMSLESDIREETDFWVAKYYGKKGNSQRAADIFKGIADSHSDRTGAESQLEYAKILDSLGENEKAVQAYLSLTYVFKGYKDLVSEALYRALTIYRSAGNTKQADILVRKLNSDYPESKWAEKLKENGN